MQFALLGDDPRIVPFLDALALRKETLLTHAVAAPPTLPVSARNVIRCAGWEELLGVPTLDAVIVAGSDPWLLDGARKFAEAGKAVLVLGDVRQTSTFVYQLTLVYAERELVLFPILLLRSHPQVVALKAAIQEGEVGAVQLLRLERTLGVDAIPDKNAINMAGVLLEDVDLLRFLGGEYNQIAASRSGDPLVGVAGSNITLQGEDLPQALWSATMSPDIAAGAWKLVVAGDKGTATLEGGSDPLECRLTVLKVQAAEGGTPPWIIPPAEGDARRAASAVLETFLQVAAGETRSPTWTDLSRDFELVEAVDRSVARRRTVDVYFEVPSERSAFKTQMTALGCSLLVLTFFAVILYLIVEDTVALPAIAKRVITILLFVPIALFLVMQLLVFLTKPAKP